MHRVLPRLKSSAAPQPVRALALIKHAAPPGSPAAFGAVPPWSTHSSFVRRVSLASIARKLFPTASFPQTMMRVYASKVKAKIKARKVSGLRKLVPCGRTREEIGAWTLYGADERRAIMAALPARLATVERKPRRETRRTRMARERGEA